MTSGANSSPPSGTTWARISFRFPVIVNFETTTLSTRTRIMNTMLITMNPSKAVTPLERNIFIGMYVFGLLMDLWNHPHSSVCPSIRMSVTRYLRNRSLLFSETWQLDRTWIGDKNFQADFWIKPLIPFNSIKNEVFATFLQTGSPELSDFWN